MTFMLVGIGNLQSVLPGFFHLSLGLVVLGEAGNGLPSQPQLAPLFWDPRPPPGLAGAFPPRAQNTLPAWVGSGLCTPEREDWGSPEQKGFTSSNDCWERLVRPPIFLCLISMSPFFSIMKRSPQVSVGLGPDRRGGERRKWE